MIPSDEAFYMVHWSKALGGNSVAARIIYKELAARRDLSPPPLTAEELAQLEAEQAERVRMAENIMDALDEVAAMKRDAGLAARRFGPDGKPILDGPAWNRPAEPSDDFTE